MLVSVAVILIIFAILEKWSEPARSTCGRQWERGMWEAIRLGLRYLTGGKGLALKDGKGRDRSKVIRAVLDRHWGRGEASVFSVQVGKPGAKGGGGLPHGPEAGLQGHDLPSCLDAIYRS